MISKLSGQLKHLSMVLAVGLILVAPVYASNANKQGTASLQGQEMSGSKQKIKGLIVKRGPDSFTMQDRSGATVTVNLTDATKVEEKKSNPFRRAKNYATTELLRGLNVEVEGRRSGSEAIMAEKIKFSDADLMVARTVESQVIPVESRVLAAESRVSQTESRVGEAETRLHQSEENARKLSGQIDELGEVSDATRGEAMAAQKTADSAMAGVGKTNERISHLITDLDEYDAKWVVSVRFKAGSARLSEEAKTALDEIAGEAKMQKAFMIEVAGFASADGNEEVNRRLSQHRADAVVRYLAEQHMIPLRRIITPFGYGESQPVADDATPTGREQNRRVEVKVLVNRGLATPASSDTMGSSSSAGLHPGAESGKGSLMTAEN